MKTQSINSKNAPAANNGYSQAILAEQGKRVLYISGQIPVTRDGNLPDTFSGQAEIAWQNVVAQLHAADMDVGDLVKVTIFLSNRKYSLENSDARQNALGSCAPALTVIITGIFDEQWLLEIEAIAEC